jgi:hypothetical protein
MNISPAQKSFWLLILKTVSRLFGYELNVVETWLVRDLHPLHATLLGLRTKYAAQPSQHAPGIPARTTQKILPKDDFELTDPVPQLWTSAAAPPKTPWHQG